MRMSELPSLYSIRMAVRTGKEIIDLVKTVHVKLSYKTLPVVVLEVKRQDLTGKFDRIEDAKYISHL